MKTILSKKWDVPKGPAKGHLDTQLFEECEGEWCDRDIVKKNRKRKKEVKASEDVDPRNKLIKEDDGIKVWDVDGGIIREDIDKDFTNFGQHYRFKFIPEDEFWIDNGSESEELDYFIEHLFIERDSMLNGDSYEDALQKACLHEKKEREEKAEKEDDEDIHSSIIGRTEDGVIVWVVKGDVVRDLHDINFVEGGHDKVYDYVPKREVWIDDDVKEEERPFVILHEIYERGLMEEGMTYDEAHEKACVLENKCRKDNSILASKLEENGWNGPCDKESKGKAEKVASSLPSIDQMIEGYSEIFAKEFSKTQLAKNIVPEDKVNSIEIDSQKIYQIWKEAIDRFFMIYPQREHDKWSFVKTALEGVNWEIYPEAKRLKLSFIIPATVKYIKDLLLSVSDNGFDVDSSRWIGVESSVIAAVSYDANRKCLDLRLKNGKEITLNNVSPETYDDFLNSPSKGGFFNKLLKERRSGYSNWYQKSS